MEKQKVILVVEDEEDIRGFIATALRSKKFIALEAKNGVEGVGVALSEHPDLILLDLLMPEMDGMTALKKIRQDAWGANVPVIILTNLGATNEHLIEDMVAQKPLHYLIKSDWKIHDVVDKIEEVLKKENKA